MLISRGDKIMNKLVQHFDARTAQSHVAALKVKAAAINLPIDTVWALIVEYGGKIVPILMDVMAAFQGGFDWSKVSQLLVTDGPLVIQLVSQITAALGLTVPPVPTNP